MEVLTSESSRTGVRKTGTQSLFFSGVTEENSHKENFPNAPAPVKGPSQAKNVHAAPQVTF